MKISFNDFVRCCPAAMAPDDAIFNSISRYIEYSTNFLRDVITADVFASIDVEDDAVRNLEEPLPKLRSLAVDFICASAFGLAIPHLDLVLTSTGFGVVSNTNVAPASVERVRALRDALRRNQDMALDEILDLVRPMADWSKSSFQWMMTRSLFWRASQLSVFGIVNPTRDDLGTKLPDILGAGLALSRAFSSLQYMVLIDKECRAAASAVQEEVINLCRTASVAWATSEIAFNAVRDRILMVMEQHPEEFPEYHASVEFKANHFRPYENKKDDPCFFFG